MKITFLAIFGALLIPIYSIAQTSHHWAIDNLESIDGNSVTVYGDPEVIEVDTADTPFSVLSFDGEDDGIIIDGNPLVGATAFTAEVVFQPIDKVPLEPRFVHFQQDDDNRVLIELRNFEAGEWYLDTFIKSGGVSNTPLIDEDNVHPTSQWQHAALIYKDGKMSHYVNGVLELEGEASYSAMTSGKVSLGMRMNQVNYYSGYIKELRVTHKALDPSEFLINDSSSTPDTTETTPLEIDQSGFDGSLVYPNPSNGLFVLELKASKKEQITLKISDLSGRNLHEQMAMVKDGKNRVDIDATALTKGVYMLSVIAANSLESMQLLIE